jgi:hypothetical protein
MRQFAVEIQRVAHSAGLLAVQCSGPIPGFRPGQVALALSALPSQPFLRIPLYPFHVHSEGFEFALDQAAATETIDSAHPLTALSPGDSLNIVGPCGRGFDLGTRPGHLLMVAASPARLFSLIEDAVARRWSVSALSLRGALWPAVPEQLEVHRGALTPELVGWADLIALDSPDSIHLADQVSRLCPNKPRGFVQAVMDVPMPCGTGACQACWVESSPRRQMACVDMPVILY